MIEVVVAIVAALAGVGLFAMGWILGGDTRERRVLGETIVLTNQAIETARAEERRACELENRTEH